MVTGSASMKRKGGNKFSAGLVKHRTKTTGMEVPMLGAIGVSDWAAALIAGWLAVQLPLGMLVGFYLRRVNALSLIAVPELAPVYAARGRRWPEFLPVPAAPRAL